MSVPNIPESKMKREHEREGVTGGHMRLCPRCEKFQVFRGLKDGDRLRYACLVCGKSLYMVKRAGLWVPEAVAVSIEAWLDKMIKKTVEEILNPPPKPVEPEKRGILTRLRKRTDTPAKDETLSNANSDALRAIVEVDGVPKSKPVGPDLSGVRTFGDAMALAKGDFDLATQYLNEVNKRGSK